MPACAGRPARVGIFREPGDSEPSVEFDVRSGAVVGAIFGPGGEVAVRIACSENIRAMKVWADRIVFVDGERVVDDVESAARPLSFVASASFSTCAIIDHCGRRARVCARIPGGPGGAWRVSSVGSAGLPIVSMCIDGLGLTWIGDDNALTVVEPVRGRASRFGPVLDAGVRVAGVRGDRFVVLGPDGRWGLADPRRLAVEWYGRVKAHDDGRFSFPIR